MPRVRYQSGKSQQGGVYDDSDNSLLPSQPQGNARLAEASRQAGQTLGNIDDVLNENQATPSQISSLEKGAGASTDSAGHNELASLPDRAAPTGDSRLSSASGKPDGRLKKIKRFFTSNQNLKKKAAVTGGIAAFIGIAVLFVATYLPSRVYTFVNQAERRWFSSAHHTLEKQGEVLFSDYLKHHVLPSLGTCPSTRRDISCVPPLDGSSNPVTQLFNAWRLTNFENKLATEYGIELARDNASGRIYMKVTGQEDIDLAKFQDGTYNNIFDMPEVSQSEVRATLNGAIESETLARRILMRISMRNIMGKYGIVRCVVACNKQEKLAGTYQEKRRAVLVVTARRILDPFSQGFSLAMQCMLSGGCSDLVDGENGEKVPKYQQQLTAQLKAYSADFGSDKLDELFKKYDSLIKNGFLSYLGGSVGEKVVALRGGNALEKAQAKEVVGKAVTKGVPVIGWVTFAADLISGIKNSGQLMTAARYALITAGAAQTYSMYRSVADEARAGETDAAILGGFNDSLNAGAKADGTGPSAESTPWYQAEFQSEPVQTSLLNSIFGGGQAYAATPLYDTAGGPDHSTYYCDEGEPVPKGQLVCEEEVAKGGVPFFNALAGAIPGPVAALAGAISGAVGWILGPIAEILGNIQPFKDLGEWANAQVQGLLKWIAAKVTPVPFNDMSGGRAGDMAMAGADEIGNATTHLLLGGQKATPAQARAVYEEQNRKDYEEFSRQPLFARMFDKDSTFSFVSRLSLAMPNGVTAWQNTFASILGNPLNSIASSFSAIFSSNKVLAATPAVPDPIGITQYIVPDTSPSLISPEGPEAYWQKTCADGSYTKNWHENSASHINELTGQAENLTTNPCLTIEGSVKPYGMLMGYGS